MRPLIIAVLVASLMLVAGNSHAEHWTGFQGPPASQLDADTLPLSWSASENIAWQAKLVGYGQSSPVVWDGQVYVTTISGKMKEKCHVVAYDLASGDRVWQRDIDAASQAENSSYISRAAPTPVVDAEGVTVFFEAGNVVSLDHAGETRWSRNLVEDYGDVDARHGLASSLEQNAQHVFVWIERQENPYVIALNKSNGETVWKSAGLGVTTWSSPRLVPVGESHHLILSGIGRLAGLDPQTGDRLWDFDGISGNSTPTPVPLGDGRLLMGATEGRGESGGNAPESNGVIQIAKNGDGKFEANYVWRAKKATSSFGSPITYQGHAYFVNRAGALYCLDLETGEQRYAKRTAGSIWATPIAVGERLYLFGRAGTTTVVKPGPQFAEIAESKLWAEEPAAGPARGGPSFGGPVLYAAVAVGSRILMRRGDVLYCVSQQAGGQQ